MFNQFLSRLNLRLQHRETVEALIRRSRVGVELVAALTAPRESRERDMAGVVFSMDRALQLHGLLASYTRNTRNRPPLHVLYRATSQAHASAYEEALAGFQDVLATVTRQSARDMFASQLLGILGSIDAGRVFFLVDDIIFIEPFDFNDLGDMDPRAAIVSLRLGANLRQSYMVDKPQPVPALRPRGGVADLVEWKWSEGQLDWAYPLSVDGNVFLKAEIEVLARHTEFDSPNTFEGNLQQHADFFLTRLGVCYRKSRLVNVPWNKVQVDNANLHGGIHQDELLKHWQSGMRLHHESLQGFMNVGVHQEVELALWPRERDGR